MKLRILSLMLLALTLTVANAQHSHRRTQDNWRSDYSNVNNRKDVEVSVLNLRLRHPGELARQLSPEDRTQVTTLILDGVFNDADLNCLRELARRRVVMRRGKEVSAFLNLDLENARYFNGERVCDYLPDNAFFNCRTLRSVVLPYRLREIGKSAFYGCSDLVAVAVPDDVEYIGASAFQDCSKLKSFYIPDYITTIYPETFRGCTMLDHVSLPDGLTTIGNHAFRATGLTSISLPTSVRTIGENAFTNTPMRTAYIPAFVDHCAASAFCSPKLMEYQVEEGNPEYSSHDGVLYSLDGNRLICYPAGRSGAFVVPSFVTEIDPGVFRGLVHITSIEFDCPLVTVADAMFEDCTGLTRVALPEGVVNVGKEAFRGCKALTDVQLPSSLRHVGTMAFRACKALQHLELPEGVEDIGEDAFYHCDQLMELVLPSTVRLIGNKAFYNCDRMLQLVVRAPQPPLAEKINDNLKKIVLKVPAGSSAAYRSSASWGKFRNIQEE